MTSKPLRVMVVLEDALLAQRLAQEIRACGEIVVGPFSDPAEAMQAMESVQAAILDVQGPDESAFWMADRLMHSDVPFVFTTGSGDSVIPARFQGHRAYARPRHAATMLDDLHRQYRKTSVRQDDDLTLVVADLMKQARGIMPDASSAERLVEAVLLRAVAQTVDRAAPSPFRPWLMGLMDDEVRQRRHQHMH